MELEYVNCDICECNNYSLLFKARDYRFGRKEEYSVVKCNNCGLVYINPRPTAESMWKLYESCYTPDDKPLILPQIETRRIKKILKKIWHRINGQYHDGIIAKAGGRILDVGCSVGSLLLPLKQKGNEVYGIELNSKSVKACNKIGLNVFCGILEKANFPDEFFDTVIMSQTIEHFPSPRNSLKEIRRILKPGGKLYIFCPNVGSYLSKFFGRYWHGWHIPFHFYGFTEDTIKNLVRKVGFKVENISATTPDNFFIVSLKSYLWNRCDNEARPIERGKFFDSLFFRACISPFFRLLDFVSVGRGDCLRVEVSKTAILDNEI